MHKRKALIIGAGPAGLTAALELARRTDVTPIVLECSGYMGGISRTVRYKGNRMDIGGHRFFSKSDRVMKWWTDLLPVEASAEADHNITYRRQTRPVTAAPDAPDSTRHDQVMLIRSRKSRVFFLRQFFDYPISLSVDTLSKLGVSRTIRIGLSYAKSLIRKTQPEETLEQFLINRFGRELYLTFFKSYTEKVWGVPCDQISAEWGAQRIKGLSIKTAIQHFLKKTFAKKTNEDLSQKNTETSLIEKFMYPKYGPGQLWECVADKVRSMGGSVESGWKVDKIHTEGTQITGVSAIHMETGERRRFEADFVFSTMPVKELIRSLEAPVPRNVCEVSEGLLYRDFITVGLLLKRLKLREGAGSEPCSLTDNWIYIQEPDVAVGRMQIFNNWSPYLVADPDKVWVGLEYFCNETDDLWRLSEEEMSRLAAAELEKIGMIDGQDVLDSCVVHVPKAYPAYFGAYSRFGEIREYVDQFANLFLIGRNGMHKYNNQDHSMLTAMTAVDNILEGRTNKDNIWALNTEMEYHETKETQKEAAAVGSGELAAAGVR